MARKHKQSGKKKWLLLSGGLIVVIAAVIATLELTNTTHWFHSAAKTEVQTNTAPASTDKGTNSAAPNANTSKTTGSGTSSKSTDVNAPAVSYSSPPKAPFGNFVSNHSASMTTNEQSVCNTDPGAKCKITFTSGSVTKSLPDTTTNSNGAAYWTWTPSSVGLTKGKWQVTATAMNPDGSYPVNTNDAILLEVQ